METTLPRPHPRPEPGYARPAAESAKAKGGTRRLLEQEWAPSLFFFISDVVCWFVIYGAVGLIRRDAFFSSGFEFAVVDLLQFTIIVQALFIIGGYSSRVEMRGLTYTAEHIIAMITALCISALILYAAATFDASMKPS